MYSMLAIGNFPICFLTFLLSGTISLARTYTLIDDLTSSPATFFDKFTFFTGSDPTNGFVNYLDRDQATEQQLLGFNSSGGFTDPADSIFLMVDHEAIISTSSSGRASVRLSSTATYDAGTLFVADIPHIPATCGAWPALWLLGTASPWPNSGEVDWIENGNALDSSNQMTLHTGAGCAISKVSPKQFSGTILENNCDVHASSDNAGCGIVAPSGSNTFGRAWNSGDGGVTVLEWAYKGFNVWFFPASQPVPESLRAGNPNTKDFGTPTAEFTGDCDWTIFQKQQIVINTSLCGDWAGNVWQSGGCAAKTGVSTCEEFVAMHPEAFRQAFWKIKSLRVYGRQA